MPTITLPPRYLEEAAQTAIARAAEARADALATAADRALVQAAMTQIGQIAVPALPHILDGLMPSVLISAPSGAMQVDGAYAADISSLLTISSAQKHVIGPDGSIQLIAVNQPAWDWSSGRRRLLIEAAQATNYWKYSEGGASAVFGGSGYSVAATANALYGTCYLYTVTSTVSGQTINLWPTSSTISTAIGGSVTLTVALVAGTLDHAAVGIYAASGAWGDTPASTAVIVSGPGAITQTSGSLWTVSGLSSAVPTLVSITRTTAVADICWPLLYLNSSGTSQVGDSIAFGRGQFEPGASATSYIPTASADAVTRIADDVRLSAVALASVTAPGGTTIVMRGSLVAATGWLAAWGQDAGVLLANAETGTWSLSNLSTGGPSSTGSLVAFGACAASGPGSAALSVGGAPVGTSSDVFGRTGDLRLGARPNGDFAASGLYLDELVVWPFAGSDAGIRSQARAWA